MNRSKLLSKAAKFSLKLPKAGYAHIYTGEKGQARVTHGRGGVYHVEHGPHDAWKPKKHYASHQEEVMHGMSRGKFKHHASFLTAGEARQHLHSHGFTTHYTGETKKKALSQWMEKAKKFGKYPQNLASSNIEKLTRKYKKHPSKYPGGLAQVRAIGISMARRGKEED